MKEIEFTDNGYLKFRHFIDCGLAGMETQEVLRIDDEDGREYMWDGTELYRLKVLKGKFGRPKSNLSEDRKGGE